MGLSTSELYLILRARDEASRVVRAYSGTLGNVSKEAMAANQALLGRGQALATVGVAMAGVGIAGVLALNKMTDSAIEYNQAVALTATQTDNVKISFQELSKMGLDVANDIAVPFKEVQPALYDIFSSIDTNAPGAALLLRNIAKAAVGGQADMETVGRATLAVLNAYKMKAQDVTKVNDTMFQLVRKGVGTYKEFTVVIGRAVPSAIKAGQTFEDLAGMMAFLTRNGQSAAMASVSAARALDTLSKPAAIANLHAIGVEVQDSTGKFRPMVDIIADMKEKLGQLSPIAQAVKLNDIFKGAGGTIQAMRFFNLAINDTNHLLPIMTQYLRNSGGAAEEAYQIMSQTPEAQMQILTNRYETMSVVIGNQLLPIKVKLAEQLSKLLDWFNKLSPETQKWIAYVAAAASAGMVLVGAIIAIGGSMLILKATIGMTGISIEGLKKAFIGLATGMRSFMTSAGPIGIALTALTIGITYFVSKQGEAQHATEGWTEALYDQNGALVDNARQLVATAIGQEGAFNNLDKLGISYSELTDALMTSGNAQDAFRAKLQAIIDVNTVSFDGVHDQIVGNGIAAKAAAEAFDTMAGDMDSAAGNARQAAMAMVGTKTTTDDLSDSTEALNLDVMELSATIKRFQGNMSAQEAYDQFKRSIKEISGLVKENGHSLDTNSVKALNNRAAVRQMFDDAVAAAEAWGKKNNKTTEEVQTQTAKNLKKVKQALIDNNFKPEDVEAFMKNLKGLPRQIDPIVKETKAAFVPPMFATGLQAGESLGTGFLNALPGARSKVRQMSNALVAESKAAFDQHSPSRVFMQIGSDNVEGLVIGMSRRKDDLTTLTLKLGRDAVQEYIKGMKEKGDDAHKEARKQLVDNVQKAYEEGLDALKSKLNDAKSYAMSWRSQMIGLLNLGTAFQAAQDKDKAEAEALKDLQKAQEDYEKSKADGDSDKAIASAANVLATAQQAYQTAAAAAATNWIDEFRNQLTQAANFMNLLQQLKASGAQEMLIQQIAAAGPEAGSAMASELIGDAQNGGGLIGQFNKQFATFDKQATALGVNFANAWGNDVGPKMGNLTAAKTVKAFREEFGPGGPGRDKLMATMDNLANDLSRTVSVNVNVNSGSIPGRASGGSTVAGSPYWVGEEGPELFVPNSSGKIIPHGKSMDMLGGDGSVLIDLDIHTQEIDPASVAAELGWEIAKTVRN